ncbi:MAG: hypothetical protein ACR2J9_01005, partial [Gaiellales bacterium]
VAASIVIVEPAATSSFGGALGWCAIWSMFVLLYVAYVAALRRLLEPRYAAAGHVSLPVALAVIVAATVLMVGALHGGAAMADLPTSRPFVVGLAGSLVFGLWFGIGLILLLDEIERARTLRSALIDRRVAVELGLLQQNLVIEGMRAEYWRKIERESSGARQALAALVEVARQSGDVGVASALTRGLRDFATGSVRETSAQLWSAVSQEHPPLRWGDVLAGVIRREPFYPLVVAVVIVIGNLPQDAPTFGIAHAGAYLIGLSGFCAAVMVVANRCMARWPAHHAALFVVTLVGLQATVPLAGALRDHLVPGSASASWMVSQVVVGVIVVVMVSAVGSWIHTGRARRRAWLTEIDARRVKAMARGHAVTLAARDVSRELHGSVQTRLIAAALAGERALASGDRAALEAAVTEAGRVLVQLEPQARAVGSIEEEVAARSDLWDGLCEIRVEIDDLTGVGADPASVGRVVEEGIANAVRHGGATRIDITVRAAGAGAIVVVIDDDGTAPNAESSGTGSAMIDAITGGAWRRTATGVGCRLEATIAAG